MKVIFLDVDGVLNSKEDLMAYREKNHITGTILYAEVEDRPLKLLQEIVLKTGAKIVLSSSWRTGSERDENGVLKGGRLFTKLQSRLKEYGMEIYDVTPSCSNMQRGDEIAEWLSENKVDNFVIFDDDRDMGKFLYTPHFIGTTYEHGLTNELKEKAIKVLNAKQCKRRRA